jgi:hypothetical protein
MKKKNKKIKFNMVKYVMLIPSRREFDDNMKKTLWWNNFDYNNFRFSALYEIQQIMLRHNDMHIKDAIRLLYQPNNIKFDKNNFITLDNENEYVSNIFLF